MEQPLVELMREGNVARITFNRPDKLNAMNSAVLEELIQRMHRVDSDPEIRAAVLTGRGRAFVAGADIEEYSRLTPETFAAYNRLSNRAYQSIASNSKPIIAAVNGYAFGGGFEIAMTCDMIVVSEKAKLALPEMKLGLIPGGGGTQRLTRLIGLQRAKEFIMTGRTITGKECADMGIANLCTSPDDLINEATRLAHVIAAQAPLAIQRLKRLMNDGASLPLEAALQLETQTLEGLFSTPDAREGIARFVNKTGPAAVKADPGAVRERL